MNATTTPAPRATSTAARARNKAPASAQPTPAALLSQMSEMLHRAWSTADDDCAIDGCILLKTARDRASEAAEAGLVAGSTELEARGFEVAALIKAVQAIPGFVTPECNRWLEAAARLLVSITNDANVMDGGRVPESRIPDPGTRQSVFLDMATSFYEAAQTDEAECNSGDSNRLLLHAFCEANRVAERRVLSAEAAEEEALNLAALVKAALRVPGDVASKDRRGRLEAAYPLLAELTNSTLEELFGSPEDDYMAIARDANFEVESLVEMMHVYEDAKGNAESVAYRSAFSRIMLLTEIVFHATKMGGSDSPVPPLDEMRRRLRGFYN